MASASRSIVLLMSTAARSYKVELSKAALCEFHLVLIGRTRRAADRKHVPKGISESRSFCVAVSEQDRPHKCDKRTVLCCYGAYQVPKPAVHLC